MGLSIPTFIRSVCRMYLVCVCGGEAEDSHSMRLFCRGVPVRMTLRRVLMEFMALDTADASFFRM